MTETMQCACENFIRNRDAVKSLFHWENSEIYPLCASIFSLEERDADTAELQRCVNLLKAKFSPISYFRGTARIAIASMLSLHNSPEDFLESSASVYKLLKKSFSSTEYLPITAMIIADTVTPEEYENIASRTREIYKAMKAKHPILTSGEDSALTALLALSPRGEDSLVEEMEQCYSILKKRFFSGDAVQSLTHVLTLGDGDTEEKCKRTVELFDLLAARGHKYGTRYELPTLGVLAMSGADIGEIADDIIEIDDFLSGQKGFGTFGVGKKQRLMYAAILSQGKYINRSVLRTAAISGAISVIVAQQAAICAAVASSGAIAGASS